MLLTLLSRVLVAPVSLPPAPSSPTDTNLAFGVELLTFGAEQLTFG